MNDPPSDDGVPLVPDAGESASRTFNGLGVDHAQSELIGVSMTRALRRVCERGPAEMEVAEALNICDEDEGAVVVEDAEVTVLDAHEFEGPARIELAIAKPERDASGEVVKSTDHVRVLLDAEQAAALSEILARYAADARGAVRIRTDN